MAQFPDARESRRGHRHRADRVRIVMGTAFLGPRGSFSEEAALLRAESDQLVAFSSFPALVSAVETGLADEAVLPIENSIEGAVSTTLDLLIHETALRIAGELVLPVRHFLVTRPGVHLEDVRIVTSHPQALGQCRRFLDRCLPGVEQVAALSTSGAVKDVAEGTDETSLAFRIRENVPGALHAILSEFAVENLQMTKIESRPSKGWLGDYVFLIDFEGHRQDERVARVLDSIRDRCSKLQIFGSYPRFPLESLRDAIDPVQPID